MLRNILFSLLAFALTVANAADAQDEVYVQIEAQPSLSVVQDRLRGYAATLEDVNGFDLGRGWYGIALGPYPRAEAQDLLRSLRAQQRIPRDSYLEGADRYGQRIWPIGATTAPIAAAPAPAPIPQTPEVLTIIDPPQTPQETPREARASEALLTLAEREALQIALQWAGYYDAAIDGAFGRGTRSSMAAWQGDNGFEVTGILTTAQRAILLGQYSAVLEGMDLTPLRDTTAGIALDLPLGAVAFDRYDSPFVHFEPTGRVPGARVLLISQPGDRDRLAGLYEIMQTLDLVPLDGPRTRDADGFRLIGRNSDLISHTEARLIDGTIKGFTLIWPTQDEERRSRILAAMQTSFAPIDGVLDPATVADGGQSIDLVAGLAIRQPRITASGFFVGQEGQVLSTANALDNCGRITLNTNHPAEIVASDPALGLAVLRPAQPLAPAEIARFSDRAPRLNTEIAVAGFSFGGVLPSATMTFGRLADLRGLNGEETLWRLAIATRAGDTGGPVLNDRGAVVGMLTAQDPAGQRLPDGVAFATPTGALADLLSDAGLPLQTAPDGVPLDPVDMMRQATAMTVLVSCWE